ncbi:sortase [Amycolatopsis antarctica]|uniref:Sortase n=1 Tax=Amycolatopsis antarctica TaxID=1854586 RepID=A0A263D8V6_9PSEU|nr:sortase [Amycolatopsis antarctica]
MLAVAAVVTGVVLVDSPEDAPPPPPAAAPATSAAPAPTTAASAPVTAPVTPADAGQPPGTVRLPGGGTASLVRKEITGDGTLPIPESLDEATWWGASLGAPRGVALLSGHVNWKGQKGPFDELWRNAPGEQVSVVDTGGGEWVYRIVDAVTLHKDELPAQAERLFDQAGPHRLVLVTCGGDYVGGTDGYEDNRIVSAELVSRP